MGDDLGPDEVSRLLGAQPTSSQRKGDRRVTSSGREIIKKSGGRRLSSGHSEPGDLNGQIRDLLSGLTSDLSIWRDLGERYECDVFCGLFMIESNEGETLEADVLLMLGERGLRLHLDIYDPSLE